MALEDALAARIAGPSGRVSLDAFSRESLFKVVQQMQQRLGQLEPSAKRQKVA